MKAHTLLIVDDKADVRLSLKFLFKNHGFSVLEASDLSQAKELIHSQTIDLVLLDMNYEFDTTSGDEGLNFLKGMQGTTAPPIIAMTAWSSVNLAVEAMQVGAKDFFAKPWDNHAVLMMVKKHLALADMDKSARGAAPTDEFTAPSSDELLWHSAAMQQLKRQIDRIAKTDATVFLRGENGTGKTCIAEYIHQQSLRSGAFVAVNMAAIAENLFESELFGHKKGAFTDAKQDRQGRFAAASAGTLFLDEIGTLGLSQQAKLLRVLESQQYERVGDNTTLIADCRVISASNADFEQLMAAGGFRTDLYFRLNTIELVIPPLRERKEDIAVLAEHFLRHHSKKYQLTTPTLSACAVQALHDYPFVGNVRELSHMMARTVLMSDHDEITEADLSLRTDQTTTEEEPVGLSLMTLEQAELKLLKMAMAQSQNQVEEAALLLGISKSAIYRRLDKFNIKTK